MYRTHTCGELRPGNAGQEVTLCGWVQRIRDKGSLIWIDLRDRYGITQLIFDESDCTPELAASARRLGREYVIGVTGTVIERSSKNPKLPTGEIEIRVSGIRVLSRSELPPFTIEDETDGGEELRMKYRYIDIRRAPVRKNLELRHKVAGEVRKYLDEQ
ncbi:MAG: hypothetical protein KJ607_10050 [Bacteroidetes bacterium]|nr:hypothetical protein [Bacteroidota bacterium]